VTDPKPQAYGCGRQFHLPSSLTAGYQEFADAVEKLGARRDLIPAVAGLVILSPWFGGLVWSSWPSG